MDFNGLLVLAAVWFLFNLISNARRKSPASPREEPQERLRPRPLPSAPDVTQQEGTRLELMLGELQRSLDDAQAGRSTRIPLPPAEEVEEGESLEVEPEVKSLEEVEVRREVRRLVDRDEEVGDIEGRRVKAAAERDSARSTVDHAAFDQRIRQEVADHTAARGYSAQQLRDAIVWREILGPPVSLRGEQ